MLPWHTGYFKISGSRLVDVGHTLDVIFPVPGAARSEPAGRSSTESVETTAGPLPACTLSLDVEVKRNEKN